MKKLLGIFLLLLLNFTLKAQYPVSQSLGSDSTLVTSKGALKSRLVNTSFTDTTSANLQRIKSYPGAQIFTTSDSNMWYRTPNANKWVQFFTNTSGTTGDTLVWKQSGNYVADRVVQPVLGTKTYTELPFITNDIRRMTIGTDGIQRTSGASYRYVMIDTTSGSNKYLAYGDGGGVGTNIYNSDGVQTDATRTYDGDGKDLVFDNILNFTANGGNPAVGQGLLSMGTTQGSLTHDDIGSNKASSFEAIFSGGVTYADVTTDDSIRLYHTDGVGSIRLGANGGMKIKGIPYTLSTTGKKIMLRDTATGLVQNIDPALMVTATPTWQQTLTAGTKTTTDSIGVKSLYVNGNYPTSTALIQLKSDPSENMRAVIQSGDTAIAAASEGSVSFATGTNANFDINAGENNFMNFISEGGIRFQNAFPSSNSFIIDDLPYTLSTTGKKIMLRDTATGLVQNIDPALLATSSIPLSSITAATGTNSIDNGNYQQTWNWNNLSNGVGMQLSQNANSATNGQRLLKVELAGANSASGVTSTSAQVTNSHSGTTSTNIGLQASSSNGTNNYATYSTASGTGSSNYGVYGSASGAGTLNYASYYVGTGATTNYGIYSQADGGTTNYGIQSLAIGSTGATNIAGYFDAHSGAVANYAIIVPASSGSVGIGTSTPTSLLHVNGTAQFGTAGSTIGRLQLSGNTSGTIGITTAAAAGTWTMTLPTDDGTSGQYLQTDGAGVTSWQTVSGSASLDTNVTTSMNGRTSMKQILQGSDSLVVLGDSYSTGAYGEWYSLFAKRFGLEAGTLALSGSGIYYAAKQANANITAANSKVLSALVGFNDLRRSSSDATYRKVAGCSRSIIASNLVNVVSTAASVTTSGTWTTFTGTTYGGRSGVAGGAYNNVSGSYKEYTATGANFIVGFFSNAATGFTGGEIDISVDGTVIKHLVLNEADGVSDGVNDNNICPGAYFISGLSTGSHTIRITNTTNNYIFLDYFATVKLPAATQPVLFSLIPYMPEAGYIQTPANGSNPSFNRGNDSIINSVNAFTGWPVSFVPINTYADTTLGMNADDIHRNVLGNQQIADAFSSAVVPGVAVSATTTLQTATDAGATTTNSISVGTSTAPPTVLYVKSANPAIRVDDSNGNNSAFLGNYLNFGIMAVNRNPSTGTFTNSGATAQQIGMEGGNGTGNISFWTSNTNNTAPTERLKIFGNGNLNLAQKFLIGDLVSTPTAWLHLPAGTATASTAPLKFTSGVASQTTKEAGAVNYDGSNLTLSDATYAYTLSKTLTGSATLDFGSTSASSSSDLTITVTGAADGDVVSIGVANAAINANSCYTAWVSSANTVTIRFNNYQSVGSIDPASATFKVSVIK